MTRKQKEEMWCKPKNHLKLSFDKADQLERNTNKIYPIGNNVCYIKIKMKYFGCLGFILSLIGLVVTSSKLSVK